MRCRIASVHPVQISPNTLRPHVQSLARPPPDWEASPHPVHPEFTAQEEELLLLKYFCLLFSSASLGFIKRRLVVDSSKLSGAVAGRWRIWLEGVQRNGERDRKVEVEENETLDHRRVWDVFRKSAWLKEWIVGWFVWIPAKKKVVGWYHDVSFFNEMPGP